MSEFKASSNATGSVNTSTLPSVLVTATASVTSTSTISQENAQDIATKTAQSVAISTAQNDANIITQTIQSSTAEILGRYSYLNISYAVPTDVGSSSTFTGLVFPNNDDFDRNTLILTYEKPVYYLDSLTQPFPPITVIPNATLNGYYSLTYVNNMDGTSTLTGQRITYKYIPYKNVFIYNVTVSTNVVLACNILITKNTKVDDINGNISTVTIINKMAQGISTYTPQGKFDKYAGVELLEKYTPDGKWNYIYNSFDRASISGSSNNIYPAVVKN